MARAGILARVSRSRMPASQPSPNKRYWKPAKSNLPLYLNRSPLTPSMARAGILARVSRSRVPASQPCPIRSLVVQLAAAASPLPAISRPYTPARTFN